MPAGRAFVLLSVLLPALVATSNAWAQRGPNGSNAWAQRSPKGSNAFVLRSPKDMSLHEAVSNLGVPNARAIRPVDGPNGLIKRLAVNLRGQLSNKLARLGNKERQRDYEQRKAHINKEYGVNLGDAVAYGAMAVVTAPLLPVSVPAARTAIESITNYADARTDAKLETVIATFDHGEKTSRSELSWLKQNLQGRMAKMQANPWTNTPQHKEWASWAQGMVKRIDEKLDTER